MTEAEIRPAVWQSFSRGFGAGFIALLLWFIVRLGGLAPFPPEAALGYILTIIPESIQEPAVQNLGELAGLLTDLVDDEPRRRSMGRAGRARIEQVLAWDHQAPRYVKVYERLAVDSRRRALATVGA